MKLGRAFAAVTVAASCALPVSGCGLFSPGTEIATPSVMTITSGEFIGNVIPVRYTCGVPNAPSPPVSWSGAPPGTKSIALVVDDADAPITPYVYWIVFNISPTTTDILQGQLPPGARQAQNSGGVPAYQPPCPGPTGHSYRFTVYALKSVLNLPPGTSLQSAWQAIGAAAIGRGRTTPSATS